MLQTDIDGDGGRRRLSKISEGSAHTASDSSRSVRSPSSQLSNLPESEAGSNASTSSIDIDIDGNELSSISAAASPSLPPTRSHAAATAVHGAADLEVAKERGVAGHSHDSDGLEVLRLQRRLASTESTVGDLRAALSKSDKCGHPTAPNAFDRTSNPSSRVSVVLSGKRHALHRMGQEADGHGG